MHYLIFFALLSTLFSCSNKDAGHLVTALSSQVKTLDPAKAFDHSSLTVLAPSVEPLYQYHYLQRPYSVIPLLAKELPRVSKDRRIYTISIKENIYYAPNTILEDKREVIVDDFINQLKRIAYAPMKSSGYSFFKPIQGFDNFSNKVGNDWKNIFKFNIEGVKKLSKYEMSITLDRPVDSFINTLTTFFLVPIPREYIERLENNLDKNIVGTGAFGFKSRESSANEFVFERNPLFREERYPNRGDRFANQKNLLVDSDKKIPFLDKVTIRIITDESKIWESFFNNETDVLNVPKIHLKRLSEKESILKEKEINVSYYPALTTRWISFNMRDPLLGKNRFLRLAIAHAIDRQKYTKLLTNNTSVKATSLFPPELGNDKRSSRLPYSYNIEKAKRFMDRSKLKNVSLTYSTRDKSETSINEAKFIQESLEKIGIKVEINIIDFSEFLSKGRKGELQFFTDSWIYDYPAVENFLQLLITKNSPGINKSGFSNIAVDKQYEELSRVTDLLSRQLLISDIEEQVNYSIPWVMMLHERSYTLTQKGITNLRPSSFNRNYFKYLRKK